MKFRIIFKPGAAADLSYFSVREQRVIVAAIRGSLSEDAHVESARKKQLRPNELAPRELRIGVYRVFYEIEEGATVNVLAIGHKQHNELYIQGKKVEL
jgi:mRNA-degrading endonuclease RelE of RelBE toxin-antitoxin system